MKTDQTLTALANIAVEYVIRGASAYLQAHNLKADDVALATCCRHWAKIRLDEALADAKEALDCRMERIAIATFQASMMGAGIEAAKEVSFSVAA